VAESKKGTLPVGLGVAGPISQSQKHEVGEPSHLVQRRASLCVRVALLTRQVGQRHCVGREGQGRGCAKAKRAVEQTPLSN
jgi:hypothetical protein